MYSDGKKIKKIKNKIKKKMVLMNLFAGQEQRSRHREKSCGHSGERRRWDEMRK